MHPGGISQGAQFILNNPLPPAAYNPLDHGIFVRNDNNGSDEDEHRGGGGQRQRRRRRNGEDDDADDDESDDEPIYYPVACDDVAENLRELGKPGPRHKCFGCMYVGQNRAAKIPDNRLQEVFQTMADGIGVSWPPALAVQVGRQYESWRGIINATRGERDKLPKWSPASILDHWISHTADPEIAQWLDLTYLRYSINKIRSCGLEKKNRLTGAVIHDREQAAIMRDMMRMFYVVSAKEPRKLSYYFEGAMINHQAVANGGISRKRRPVYDFFQKTAGKRHRAIAANFNDP